MKKETWTVGLERNIRSLMWGKIKNLRDDTLDRINWYKNLLILLRETYLYKRTPIIIYSIGKTGTTSFFTSLKTHGSSSVYHIHRMNKQHIDTILQTEHIRTKPSLDRLGEALYEHIIKKHRAAKIITLVREPIVRNISAFFQNFRIYTGTRFEDSQFTIEEMIDIFMKTFRHDAPLTWFDAETKTILGIDVFSTPFPKQTGYTTFQNGPIDLLLMKSELVDTEKEKALAQFLGLPTFHLVRSNVATEKAYGKTYQHFMQRIVLPASYIETMCQSPYVQHFYDDVEIAQIHKKWSRASDV